MYEAQITISSLHGKATISNDQGTQEVQRGDHLKLYDTLFSESDCTLDVDGKALHVSAGETLYLEESVFSEVDFESSISQESMQTFLSSFDIDIPQDLIAQSGSVELDGVNELSTSQIDEEVHFDIEDILDMQGIHTQIFSDETKQLHLNTQEWSKQESKITDGDHTFDLYTKNDASNDVYTLLIEEDISIINSQG